MDIKQHLKNLGLPFESEPHPKKRMGETVYLERNKLYDLIFPIDKQTGLPTSNIQLVLAKNISPDLKNYIMQNIAVELPSVKGAPSDDVAFDLMVTHECGNPLGRERFYERVSKYVSDFESKYKKAD